MNIIDLTPGQQIIARIHEQGCPINEFPARFNGANAKTDGTWTAQFLFQPAGNDAVWHQFAVRSLTTSGPWTVAQTHMLFTVRPELHVTITELAAAIAYDGTATPELEARIIDVLGMDPDHVDGSTPIGEDAAEQAHAAILATA